MTSSMQRKQAGVTNAMHPHTPKGILYGRCTDKYNQQRWEQIVERGG